MATRPKKKAKCQAPVRLTRKQQRLLEKAAVNMFWMHVDVWDPFAPLLLEAAKTNTDCKYLTIKVTMNEKVPRKFLDALAQFLVVSPCMKHLYLEEAYPDPFGSSVGADEAGDDYTALIAAVVGSQSLQDITIERCLPLKLEEAIIEVLRQKSTSMTLELRSSMLFAVHPIAFGKMLATTKCLSHLILRGVKVVGDLQYDRSHFRDGLQKNQSLTGFNFLSDCESWILNDVLECAEGIESLTVKSRLNSTTKLLLNTFVTEHKKLTFLYVYVDEVAVKELCEAVSCSQSLTELVIGPYSHVCAISRMLQQTTSLQKLHLIGNCDYIDFKTLAVGLEACKTLTRLETRRGKLNVQEAHALLTVVLTNHNFSEITSHEVQYHTWVCRQKENRMSRCHMDLSFYLAFNKQGRALLTAGVPLGVWPYALKKAGSSSLPDALYFFLQEMPELIKYHSSVH